MAKKIELLEISRAVGALKDFHIEHCAVKYPKNQFIVIKNKNLDDVLTAIEAAGLSVLRVKSMRHYENFCLNHFKGYYEPKK